MRLDPGGCIVLRYPRKSVFSEATFANLSKRMIVPSSPQSDIEATGPASRSINELWPAVYDELRRLATNCLSSERADHTLQPTALVHEAYLRLIGQRSIGWDSRAQFFAAAAKAMRRILVDHARKRGAVKRGGLLQRTVLDETVAGFEERGTDLIQLSDAITRLAAVDQRKADIAELRVFAGLSVEDTASVLACSTRTVIREWAVAKAWLWGEMTAG